MISFPRFGQYTCDSYKYNDEERQSRKRQSFTSTSTDSSDYDTCSVKIRKSRKSKKSILMDLVYRGDDEEFQQERYMRNSLTKNILVCQPYLVVASDQMDVYDPNFEIKAENFPSDSYASRYFEKLGLKNVKGHQIAKPYDFGYYCVYKRKKTKKPILKYGARCGHCDKFIRIKNESPEGGFLSFIGYYRHWINVHYDGL